MDYFNKGECVMSNLKNMVDFTEFLEDIGKKSSVVSKTSSTKLQYPTGFMKMDYGAGSYLIVHDEETEVPVYTYHNIGILMGSVNVIISKSQGGKTTLCLRMAQSIIEPYINMYLHNIMMQHATDVQKYGVDTVKPITMNELDGMPFIQIADTEKTLSSDYVKRVTNFTNKMVKRHVIISQITTDKELIYCLEAHVKYKVAHMKKILMPMRDIFGKPIYDYPPTVLIIDSTSQLLLEECDDPNSDKKSVKGISDVYADAIQNTAGARRAKIISALYSQLVNYANQYNIIIFSINHINKMLPVNGIPVKQYRGLRAGETIGGGERAIFLASTILRLDVIKNVSATGSTSVNLGDDIHGHIAVASWIKSKSNSKSNVAPLVYTNENGYDPLLSNLWGAKEDGILIDSGRTLAVPKYENLKFTLKNYREIFAANPELLKALYRTLRDHYEPILDDPIIADKRNRELIEKVRKDIHTDTDMKEHKSDVHDMDDIFASLIND